MNSTPTTRHRSTKATKIRALLAGGIILGIGATFTLAAWTDNEWLFGSSGGNNGPGTKVYHMEQNTFSNTNGTGADAWSAKPNMPTLPDANVDGALTFGVTSSAMLPGTTVYAPMQLRAAAGSQALTATLAQGVQLAGANTTTNTTALYTALTYRAMLGVTKANCAAGVLTGATDLVAAGSALSTASAVPIALPAGATSAVPGTAVDVCFAITLPTTAPSTLQGQATVPLWRFTSTVGS
ncbi:hypothetical protein [Psychromicrobium xiongbiense]|uniref:hypothetical protein n=1 Tax=Psychromicrobium xiongbiense TaxID=3051184 RepID=UPI0025561F75|nr:hypothetical protein [Psychromicrobium sp. YIM S02556]